MTSDPGTVGDPAVPPPSARIAVNFCIALEAWAKPPRVKMALTPDFPQEAIDRGLEDLSSTSWYEYGGRSGFPRLLRILNGMGVKASVSTSALAAERWPELATSLVENGHEVVAHGYSQDHRMFLMSASEDLAEVKRSRDVLNQITGVPPVGWSSQGGQRGEFTVASLLHEGFIWTNDFRDSDVPYVVAEDGPRRVVAMPRTDEINDAMLFRRFGQPPSVYIELFKRAFETLCEERDLGLRTLTAVAHPTYYGRPFGVSALVECIKYAQNSGVAWICRRRDVAEYFLATNAA